MSQLIRNFADVLTKIEGVKVDVAGGELLVQLNLQSNRKQSVKVSHLTVGGKYDFLQFYSRAAVATDHNWVKLALKLNGNNEIVSLVLNTQVKPHYIDVKHSVPSNWSVEDAPLQELWSLLQRVAVIADKLEFSQGKQDIF